MSLEIKKILELAHASLGSYAEICKQTGLNKTTLWKIREGKTSRTQDRTIAKLVKVINANAPTKGD